MKVALSLFDIIWEDKEANYKKARLFAKKAYDEGAMLLLLPEMSFTGFSMNTEKIAEKAPYVSVEHMQALSEKYMGLGIGFGYAGVKDKEKPYNCLEVVYEGRTIMRYDKIHPFSYGEEDKYYSAGEKIARAQLAGVKMSGFVCYDLRFPEIFQIASKESDFIFVIANWAKDRVMHWKTLLQARAIENQCYVAGVNRIGEGDGVTFEASSVLFDPLGKQVEGTFYKITDEEGILGENVVINPKEGILIVDIDKDDVTKARSVFPHKKDRKEALYSAFYQ